MSLLKLWWWKVNVREQKVTPAVTPAEQKDAREKKAQEVRDLIKRVDAELSVLRQEGKNHGE